MPQTPPLTSSEVSFVEAYRSQQLADRLGEKIDAEGAARLLGDAQGKWSGTTLLVGLAPPSITDSSELLPEDNKSEVSTRAVSANTRRVEALEASVDEMRKDIARLTKVVQELLDKETPSERISKRTGEEKPESTKRSDERQGGATVILRSDEKKGNENELSAPREGGELVVRPRLW